MGQAIKQNIYRPTGCQITFSDSKILLSYADRKGGEGSNEKEWELLAQVEIDPDSLFSFFIQIAEAGLKYQNEYKKNIGFEFLNEEQ